MVIAIELLCLSPYNILHHNVLHCLLPGLHRTSVMVTTIELWCMLSPYNILHHNVLHCVIACCQVSSEPGNQYNITLMNSLVLYVGTQAITYIHSKGSSSSTSTIAHTAHMDIFQHLVVDLDTEGECQIV